MNDENKHMKVWALSYETTVPFQDPIFHECLFDSYEKALKEFNKTVEDDKSGFWKIPKARRFVKETITSKSKTSHIPNTGIASSKLLRRRSFK